MNYYGNYYFLDRPDGGSALHAIYYPDGRSKPIHYQPYGNRVFEWSDGDLLHPPKNVRSMANDTMQ